MGDVPIAVWGPLPGAAWETSRSRSGDRSYRRRIPRLDRSRRRLPFPPFLFPPFLFPPFPHVPAVSSRSRRFLTFPPFPQSPNVSTDVFPLITSRAMTFQFPGVSLRARGITVEALPAVVITLRW